MTLECPTCETRFASTRDLTHVCNLCDEPAHRPTSRVFKRDASGNTVLVCTNCLPLLMHTPLEVLLEQRDAQATP